VPAEEAPAVERAGSWYAQRHGPFPVWLGFCEQLLNETNDPSTRSNALWTLGQMALRSGELERAKTASEEKQRIDQGVGNEREAALAAGVLADILEARGEYEEALRIRREEELPVFERLGDVRSCAVTQGQIAYILQKRGEYEEALRILREDALPVYERLGDVRSRAVTQGKIANILKARGEYEEALRIRREEALPVYERLGATRDLLIGRANLAQTYLNRGKPEDRPTAVALLRLALSAAEALRIPPAVQWIRSILQRYKLTDEL